MFPNFVFNEREILCFAMVLLRVSAFVISWPMFSVFSVPQTAKILFAMVLTICLYPVVAREGLPADVLNHEIAWIAAKEVFIGLCLGFFTRLVFFAVSVGGNLVATSMGLASGQMFNPTLNMQSTTVEEFYVAISTILFLTLNGHHFFLGAMASSFTLIPLSLKGANLAVLGSTGGIVGAVCLAGIKISAPIMVSVLLLNLAMGIVGRAVPQINVLITSLPVNILVGLIVMILMIPLFISQMDQVMVSMSGELMRIVKAL